MRKSMKAALAVAAAATMALGSTLPAAAGSGSASGGGCTYYFNNSTSSDYAWNTRTGDCSGQWDVRHMYYLNGSPGVEYWTAWGTPSSPVKKELVKSQHHDTILGNTYRYDLDA